MAKPEKDEREPRSFSTLEFPFLRLSATSVHSPDHPTGISTPPLRTSASVPFKWEEQPGKPRPCTDIIALPGHDRILEPPPCRILLMDSNSKITKMPSPTTVFDGPYIAARPKFSSFRFFRESFDSTSSDSPYSSGEIFLGNKVYGGGQKRRGIFGRGLRFKSGKKIIDGGNFGFSSSSSSTTGCASADERSKMEGKMKRNVSFTSLSKPTSPRLSATMYERLKHAIAWKSTRKSKKDWLHLDVRV